MTPREGHLAIHIRRRELIAPLGGTAAADASNALALWEPFQQCLSKHLSELTEGQIDREEMF
jgi:hypothetical protein